MINGAANRNKWMVFAIIGMANLVAAFSINSFTLALPALEKEFSVGQGTVSWLAMVYSLVPCCTLLFFGRMGELFGYKRQFKRGFLFFGSVCLAAPLLSVNIGALIFFRCLQGLAYSVMISITQAVVGRAFPVSERGRALSVNSVFVSVGLAAGPTLGGLLLTAFSWRALFYFNIPFCLLGFLAARRFLPDDAPVEKGRGQMDLAGAVLLAVAAGSLVIGLDSVVGRGFETAVFPGCMGLCGISLALFIRREMTAPSPLMRLRLFKDRAFCLANAVCLLSYLVQQLTIYLMPYYLIGTLLLKENVSGLIMLAYPALMMIFSPAGGLICDRKGARLPAGAGLVLIFTGCLIMGLRGGTPSLALAMCALILAGAGNGFSVSPINTVIISAAPIEHAGVASGMLATMRNLGQTFGVLSGTLLLAARQPLYGRLTGQNAYLSAQSDAFLFGSLMAVAALVLVWFLPRKKKNHIFKHL